MTDNPFASVRRREKVRVTFLDGRPAVEGSYEDLGAVHHVLVPRPGWGAMPEAVGPIDPAEVAAVVVTETLEQLMDHARHVMHGDRIPGRDPVTRDDFEYRLQQIARAHAVAERAEKEKTGPWQRPLQIGRQFDEVADRIGLAKGKRAWMLKEAAWYLSHNAPPTMADLWMGNTASPSFFARPRPQDFDPDPVKRRKRVAVPDHVRLDPRSITNMLAALQAAGLRARLDRLGDPPWDAGSLVVDFPQVKGRSRFILVASRNLLGAMAWDERWDGNYSKPGLARWRKVEKLPAYARMQEVLRTGRVATHLSQARFPFMEPIAA